MINGYPRGRSDRKLFPEQASPTRVTSLMVLVEGDDNFRSPPPRAPRSLFGTFFGTAGSLLRPHRGNGQHSAHQCYLSILKVD
jgi:hypothetical protein